MRALTIQEIQDYDARHRVLETLYSGLHQGGGLKAQVSPKALLAIISAWESIRTEDKVRDLPQNEGPAAHEDLTIGEQIALLATVERNGDGLLTFNDTKGAAWDLPEEHVESFLEEHGHLHSSDYREEHGRRWEEDFFILHDIA
jgi:hypothetical protein